MPNGVPKITKKKLAVLGVGVVAVGAAAYYLKDKLFPKKTDGYEVTTPTVYAVPGQQQFQPPPDYKEYPEPGGKEIINPVYSMPTFPGYTPKPDPTPPPPKAPEQPQYAYGTGWKIPDPILSNVPEPTPTEQTPPEKQYGFLGFKFTEEQYKKIAEPYPSQFIRGGLTLLNLATKGGELLKYGIGKLPSDPINPIALGAPTYTPESPPPQYVGQPSVLNLSPPPEGIYTQSRTGF